MLADAAQKRRDGNALALEADQIMSSQPDSPEGYLFRAQAEIFRKQFATAEEYINRALQKSPGDPAASIALGRLRLAQNNPAEAQKAFQQALDQDQTSYEAVAGLMDVSLIQKQPDKAAALAKSQIDKYPNNSGFHYLLGHVMAEQKNDPAGAEVEFKRSAELDKSNLAALLELGSAQVQQGKTDQALNTYLQAAQANPKATDFTFRAGQIYERQQDWDKAKQLYRRVLELEPDNPIASNQLAYVMLEQGGNVDVALAMAQKARRQFPNEPSFCDTLGWAYYHKGVYNSAVDLFKEAIKGSPNNPTYNYHLGLAYARNGQSAQARQQLDRLLKIKPDYSDADKLRQALAASKT
jgi:tetratricopeptide (TPR) repeat protein